MIAMMMRIVLVTAGASVLTACAESTAPASQGGTLCGLDTADRLDAAFHDYLLAHGDVVLQALQENQVRQRAAAAESARQALVTNRVAIYDAGDPSAGNPNGDVTVVEFFDAECPYCKRVAPDLARLYGADKGVRVVFKEYPILGPMSVTAAKAALAARKQGKYEAFHNALMSDKTPEHQLTEPHIFEIAQAAHLDLVQLKRDLVAPDIDAQITANIALAHKLGITGTPTIIVGDRLMPGAASYDVLKAAVAEARAPKTAASE